MCTFSSRRVVGAFLLCLISCVLGTQAATQKPSAEERSLLADVHKYAHYTCTATGSETVRMQARFSVSVTNNVFEVTWRASSTQGDHDAVTTRMKFDDIAQVRLGESSEWLPPDPQVQCPTFFTVVLTCKSEAPSCVDVDVVHTFVQGTSKLSHKSTGATKFVVTNRNAGDRIVNALRKIIAIKDARR